MVRQELELTALTASPMSGSLVVILVMSFSVISCLAF